MDWLYVIGFGFIALAIVGPVVAKLARHNVFGSYIGAIARLTTED